MKSIPVIAAAALIAAGSWAQASEPMVLEDNALDRVTAGLTIFAFSYVPPSGSFVNSSFGSSGGITQNTFAQTLSSEQFINGSATASRGAVATTSLFANARGRGTTGAFGGAVAGAGIQ